MTSTAPTGCRRPRTSTVWRGQQRSSIGPFKKNVSTLLKFPLHIFLPHGLCVTEIKVLVVSPPTEDNLKKCQRQETFLVEETEADYHSITLPYIDENCCSVQVGIRLPTTRRRTYKYMHIYNLLFSFSYNLRSGSTTSWKRRQKLKASCTRTPTQRSASSSCHTSSGTRNR